jgi:hypothetical protein
MFPHKVRTLVIDGVLDPVAWATGRGGTAATEPYSTREHGDQGSTATFRQFLSLCDGAGAGCSFSGGAAAKFATLVARVKKHPIVLPGPGGSVAFTYADVIGQVRDALDDTRYWPGLAGILQQLYLATSPVHAVTIRHRLAAPAPAPYDNILDAQLAVACTGTDNPRDPFAWPRAAAAADRSYPYFGSIWTYDSQACATWPVRDTDRYTGPFNRHLSARVLVIGNIFDPATRYQNAAIVARETPGARLLTLNGWGHNSLGKSSCVNGFVAQYLIDGSLPAAGTVCQPDHLPFGAK